VLVTIDCGNTQTVIGLFSDHELVDHWRIATAVERTSDELALMFQQFLSLHGTGGEPITGMIIGSGVPRITAALREMILPGLLAVLSPVAVGFLGGVPMLTGFLIGVTISGVALAIFMSNAGGAWDNAKKTIEAGAAGGKGSDAHKAAVVGDTVGDPFKDTAGPSLNILIKLMGVMSVVIAPMLKRFWGY